MRICKDCCDVTIKSCYLCSIGQEIISNAPSYTKSKRNSGGEREKRKSQNHRTQQR